MTMMRLILGFINYFGLYNIKRVGATDNPERLNSGNILRIKLILRKSTVRTAAFWDAVSKRPTCVVAESLRS
ncbi:hypothetical protein TUM19329_02990 [Legionella antarctica]|uniref:Uncharacterized protein n=1 Tax=Legionella antarctica TaxID=2708020 RepID=A0A6F8T0M2_9GAMM|nr:hypothetical protein TUM19329_02990 [Legionella antarctica]